MQPLVSILIPAYNSQQWIADTIRSAIGQTWPRKEVIVVDDGSSDQTAQIAGQFVPSGVRVVTQVNQGAAAARNMALSMCNGDYIQWLDADDLLERDKIEKQLQGLSECPGNRTLLSGAWAYFMYRKGKAQFTPSPLWCDLKPIDWLLRKMGQNLQMQTDNWLVSRELTTAAGPWDTRLWRDNDGEYFSRVILASDGVKFVPAAKSYYRRSGFTSISYIGGSSKKLESLFLSMTLHMHYLRSLEDSDRTRQACLKYIETWLAEFYPFRPDIVEELKRMTTELGGQFVEPQLSWKYNWLLKLGGWKTARRAQILPRLRASSIIAWDRAMFQLENRRDRTNSRST
jgi:glycosyltransferase involved in cell wall biosynthesis